MRMIIHQKGNWKKSSIQSFYLYWTPNIHIKGPVNMAVNRPSLSSFQWSFHLMCGQNWASCPKRSVSTHMGKNTKDLSSGLGFPTNCVMKFFQASIKWRDCARNIGCWQSFMKTFLPLGLPRKILPWVVMKSNTGISHLAAVWGRHWWET